MANIEFEDIKIRFPELRIWLRDHEIYPTFLEFRLLLVMVTAPRETFSTDELVTRLDLPSHQALHTTICGLRKKLEQKYIITMRGYGYAFAGENGHVAKI